MSCLLVARFRDAVFASLLALAVFAPPVAAGTLQPVRLPRDHGAHPQFSVEWWYTTGHATASRGRRYFWFATIWATPRGAVGRVNVVRSHARQGGARQAVDAADAVRQRHARPRRGRVAHPLAAGG